MPTAALYVRTAQAGPDHTAITNQLLRLHAFCQTHNLRVEREYIDEGVSGLQEMSLRGAGKNLLNAAREHQFDTLVIQNCERLSRDFPRAKALIRTLSERGISVRIVDSEEATNAHC